MTRVEWTVAAARTQSIVHFIIALFALFAVAPLLIAFLASILLAGLLGVVPGLVAACVSWGLWNRRAWARRAAMAFDGLIAITALSVILWSIYECVTVKGVGDMAAWGAVMTKFYCTILAGIAFGVLVLASGFLWWFWRARDPEKT